MGGHTNDSHQKAVSHHVQTARCSNQGQWITHLPLSKKNVHYVIFKMFYLILESTQYSCSPPCPIKERVVCCCNSFRKTNPIFFSLYVNLIVLRREQEGGQFKSYIHKKITTVCFFYNRSFILPVHNHRFTFRYFW